jgi:hypothetical protein
MSYQVFISFKKSHQSKTLTPDAVVAEKLYKLFRDNKVGTFYSEESLAECGAGQFSRAIEKALDEAKVLVLVGSCRENIESRWVEAEWDSFLNDVRSGHKEGHLFIVNCGTMKPSELPLFLRRQQMFREDELSRLLQFVLNALPDSPKRGQNLLVDRTQKPARIGNHGYCPLGAAKCQTSQQSGEKDRPDQRRRGGRFRELGKAAENETL